MFDKMKDMMAMKKQADEMKKQLDAEVLECSDVRGIKITINGSQVIQKIELDEGRLNPEYKSRFENDLSRAINTAVKKSQNKAAQKMRTMMPGGFPGF